MPPFVGNSREKESLSQYLATLGGGELTVSDSSAGQAVFEEKCVFCHAEKADWPMSGLVKNRDSGEMFEIIGRLPEMNPIMPPFEGTIQQKSDLAGFLATLDPDQE